MGNVTSAFSILRTKTNFQDVTLVSNGHKQISAHRVVLTACSGYFNDVLSQNTHSHPLLCLDGIDFSELSNVLDYIYNGELQIYQEDLERFLYIAKKLQLQGLLSSEDKKQEEKIEELTTFETQNKPDSIFEPGMTESENMNLTVQNEQEK